MSNASLIAKAQKKIQSSYSQSHLAVPLSIASFVGVVTGFVIVGFIYLIDLLEKLVMEDVPEHFHGLGPLPLILIPTFVGLLIGIISKLLVPQAKEQGVPEVLKAIALKGGRLPIIAVFARGITSILAIGSGFSVGREGPAVHLGSGIGSNIAKLFKLSELRTKNLAACGAAAGIAAVFNAPITGVMFALEVILRDFGARALSTVVVSAVASSIVSRIFLGASPAFMVPVYKLWSSWEILIYMGLGLLSAFVALLFIASLDKTDTFFETKVRIPVWTKPALGGFLIGCIGVFFPEVFGMGFKVLENILHGSFPVHLLFILIFMKIIATVISLGSGSTGGTFAPTLFVGGALGGAIGRLFYGRMPFDVAPPGAYALVGMASVFAGAFHAPVTAILLVFEMTGDYHMILPLMLAAVIAASVAQAIRGESIDTVKFKKQGIDIESVEGASVLGALQVRDAMSNDFETISRNTPAKTLMELMSKSKDKTFYVVNSKGELAGVIRPKVMQEILLDNEDIMMIVADDIASPLPEMIFPEEPLGEAARLMKIYHITELPVVSTANHKMLVGVLQSEDVFQAYTDIAVKRQELISRMEQEGHQAEDTFQIRFMIPRKSPIVGKLLRDLKIPDGAVLTSLKRNKVTVIPEGHTELKRNDKIWAVVLPQNVVEFREWMQENKLQDVLG